MERAKAMPQEGTIHFASGLGCALASALAVGLRRLSPSEKQSPKLLFAEDSLHLSECKERDEGAEYDHAPAEQIIDANLAEHCCDPLLMDEVFNHFFNDVKGEDEQAEQKCFINRRINQWL